MVDVFVERYALSPATGHRRPDTVSAACCDLHKARWQASYVAETGPRICHYRAPDAESVRVAFRKTGISVDAIWAGTVLGSTRPSTDCIVLDLRFPPPLPADAMAALALAQAGWLMPVGLRLAQAFVSANHGRVICLCEHQDRDLSLLTRSESGDTTGEGRVWSCRSIALPY